MSANRLKLNADKTEVMLFGPRHILGRCDIDSVDLGGLNVKLSTTVRNLGFILDPELSLDAHVKRMTSTCFYQLRQLKTIRRSLNSDTAQMLVHAFVTSRLDYCNSLLAGASKSITNPQRCGQTCYQCSALRSYNTSIA